MNVCQFFPGLAILAALGIAEGVICTCQGTQNGAPMQDIKRKDYKLQWVQDDSVYVSALSCASNDATCDTEDLLPKRGLIAQCLTYSGVVPETELNYDVVIKDCAYVTPTKINQCFVDASGLSSCFSSFDNTNNNNQAYVQVLSKANLVLQNAICIVTFSGVLFLYSLHIFSL